MTKTLAEWQKEIHQVAVDHGWWKPNQCAHENAKTFLLDNENVSWCKDCGSLGENVNGTWEWIDSNLAKERNIGEVFMLFVTEIAEAYEEIRHNHNPDEIYLSEGNKPEGPSVEIIDLLIRTLDWLGSVSVDTEKVLELKHEYNKTRTYRHGGLKS